MVVQGLLGRAQQLPLILGEVHSHGIKGYLLLKCHPRLLSQDPYLSQAPRGAGRGISENVRMGPGLQGDVLKGFWLLRDTLEPSWGHLGSATSEGSPHNAEMFTP